MLKLIRRRWLAAISILLLCLAAGAGWAALATPRYQSVARFDDPELLILEETFPATNVPEARDADTTVTVSRSGTSVFVTVEADDGGIAFDVAQSYSARALTAAASVRLMDSADFPLTPHSPNLGRVALVAGLLGVVLGISQAAIIDRLFRAAPGGPSDLEAAAQAETLGAESESDGVGAPVPNLPAEVQADLAPTDEVPDVLAHQIPAPSETEHSATTAPASTAPNVSRLPGNATAAATGSESRPPRTLPTPRPERSLRPALIQRRSDITPRVISVAQSRSEEDDEPPSR